MVFKAQFHQIPTYSNITPKGDYHVFVFICIDFVDLFTDATHNLLVSFPYKCNAVLKSFRWKGQKTVGRLLLFCSLLLLASGGVTHFVLMPLHFITTRRLNCYICGPTRQVISVFVTMQGGDSCRHFVYKVMEEQHNMDSLVPKEPAILKDEMHLNQFALQLCCTHGIPEHDTNGHPANIFEMNTSTATLSVQCGDENSLYLEGNRVKPQCFSCHVDDKNDPEYRDVWVVYKHVQDPKSHLWFCVGNVFSYCKSCGDYIKRLSNGRYLKERQLGPYMEHYRS
jgi:hypothetical protein